jgi:hypothetical protein
MEDAQFGDGSKQVLYFELGHPRDTRQTMVAISSLHILSISFHICDELIATVVCCDRLFKGMTILLEEWGIVMPHFLADFL